MDENHGGDPTQPPPPSTPTPPVFIGQPETQSVGVLGTIIVVLGILAWIAIAVFIGLVISFGACFKQECSTLESGAPLWAGLLALVVLMPSMMALFRRRLTQGHVVAMGIPLVLGLALIVLNVIASLTS